MKRGFCNSNDDGRSHERKAAEEFGDSGAVEKICLKVCANSQPSFCLSGKHSAQVLWQVATDSTAKKCDTVEFRQLGPVLGQGGDGVVMK